MTGLPWMILSGHLDLELRGGSTDYFDITPGGRGILHRTT